MLKKMRMGKTIRTVIEFWEALARKEGNDPISSKKLTKVGCPVAYTQLRTILPKMARNGLAKKLSHGKYILEQHLESPSKKSLALPVPATTISPELAKIKIDGKMTKVAEELQNLQTKYEECLEAVVRVQKIKSELEEKKCAKEIEMAKLKKIFTLMNRCPDFAEVAEYLKEFL